jgi:hypothetical protein
MFNHLKSNFVTFSPYHEKSINILHNKHWLVKAVKEITAFYCQNHVKQIHSVDKIEN